MANLDVSVLRTLVYYRDGLLFWHERDASFFKDDKYPAERLAKVWNTRNAHKPALQNPDGRGYRGGHILGLCIKHHRAVWAVVHGVWPKHQIDHIDGDRSNDRVENMRDVPPSENCKNLARSRANKSGTTGVCFRPRAGKWRAYIKVSRRVVELGQFSELNAAIAARKSAEVVYGFHGNHDRPARRVV